MFVLVKDGAVDRYPYFLSDLKKKHPNVSFPAVPSDEQLAVFNVFRIHGNPEPAYDHATQVLEYPAPVFDGSKWVQTAVVRSKTQAEIDSIAANVRAERTAKLRACDWTQIADSSADKPGWLQYRAALRAIPQQPGFPTSVTWPDEPTVTP